MKLFTDRLTVEIAEPGIFPANTSRFDWTGFVTSVKLDNTYEFCTKEPTNLVHPSTGGQGLCNEYICPEFCGMAKKGERFVKFGIGLFMKPDTEEYCFYRKYDIKPFQMHWEQQGVSKVTFITEPDLSVQNSIRQIKTIQVEGQDLEMTVEIENTGKKYLNMEEFCHNFLTINQEKIGPEYHLQMPFLKENMKMKAGTFCGNNGEFSFEQYSNKAALLQIKPEEVSRDAEEYSWMLYHDEIPAYVKSTDNFCPSHVDVWSIDHIVSVETFFPVRLAPGEKVEWKRLWHFGKKGE